MQPVIDGCCEVVGVDLRALTPLARPFSEHWRWVRKTQAWSRQHAARIRWTRLDIELVQFDLSRTLGAVDKRDMERRPAWPWAVALPGSTLTGAHRSLLQLWLLVEPQAPHDQRHQGANGKLQAGQDVVELESWQLNCSDDRTCTDTTTQHVS